MDLVTKGVMGIFSTISGYVLYRHKKTEERMLKIEEKIHMLDRHQAELSIEIREIKSDITYIRNGMDKLIERL